VLAEATELGGYALPPGAEVFVSIYETQHMPELFARPEAFDPSRWEQLNPGAFDDMPFSGGRRRLRPRRGGVWPLPAS